MKVSGIQMNMEFANPEKNYQRVEELIRQAAVSNPDTIVLPETWNTGFFPAEDLERLSDVNGERTKKICSRLSRELNVNIVAGSVANKKENGVYNTSYIFSRKG